MDSKKEENLNFLRPNIQSKILQDEVITHKIFDGANEDDFTKRSRNAIRGALRTFGVEDVEEIMKDTKENTEEDREI